MRIGHPRLLFGFLLILVASFALAQQPAGKAAKNSPIPKERSRARVAGPPVAPTKNATPPNWVIVDYRSDAPGNVFYNTDVVKLGLALAARDPQEPLAIEGGAWRIKEIDEEDGWPWHGDKDQRIEETEAVCGQGAIAPQSGQKVPLAIEWKPTRLGVFGVYLQLDDGSGADEQMVWGFAVGYPPVAGPKPDSPVAFNLGGKDIPLLAPAHKRLGVKWIRWETGWSQNEPRPGAWAWDKTDEWVKAARDNDIFIMAIMAHAPAWAQPRINGEIPVYYWKNRPESNVTPEHLPQWREWARRFVDRYKDTVRAGIALNEPWEEGSLSGWHGNGAHYRKILKSFSDGAHAADPTFTVLGNDSGMNVENNILPAPGAIDLIDAVSIHTYRPYNAFTISQYAAYGKRVWDTESWIGTGASRIARQVVFELAQGYVRMQPLSTEFAWIKPKPAKQKGARPKKSRKTDAAPTRTDAALAPAYASPTAQSLGVLLHFIEDTDFYREVRPESAPWMFVFKGRQNGPSPDKNAAVVFGREDMWGNLPWRRIQSDGELTISDPDGLLTAHDVKGNVLARSGSSVKVPLTTSVCYVVSSKGADDLIQRLRDAAIQGLEPVQLALSDFTQPLSRNPPLRVKVTNAYNVPLSGSVEVKPPAGWTMAAASKPFADLKPGETAELSFEVAQSKPLPINHYPFTVTAKTAKGNATLAEELGVAVLVKGTPPLDGAAKDWEKLGALPVYLTGNETPVDSFTQYAMPFLDLQAQDNTAYIAQFMGMWDDEYFYVLADINDTTATLRASMEKGDWFTMHAPPNDWEYWSLLRYVPSNGGDMLNLSFNVLPYGEKRIANFPPAAQKKVAPKWQVNPADYEYSLYLGMQNRLAPGDYQQAVQELKASGLTGRALRPPKFVEAGPPVPEVWRLMAPGLARHGYYPSSPRAEKDQGLAPDAKLSVTREGNVWRYRAAIPWSELALVKPLAMKGRPVKFIFLCKNDGRTAVAWSNEARSIARCGQEIMHPTTEAGWSPDTEWGFVDLKTPPKE